MFFRPRPSRCFLLEAVDDLDAVEDLAVLEDLQAGPFDDQVVQIPPDQLFCADLGDELGFLVFLGVVRVEAVLVLDQDAALRPDETIHVGAVDGNPPLRRRQGVVVVGGIPCMTGMRPWAK